MPITTGWFLILDWGFWIPAFAGTGFGLFTYSKSNNQEKVATVGAAAAFSIEMTVLDETNPKSKI